MFIVPTTTTTTYNITDWKFLLVLKMEKLIVKNSKKRLFRKKFLINASLERSIRRTMESLFYILGLTKEHSNSM